MGRDLEVNHRMSPQGPIEPGPEFWKRDRLQRVDNAIKRVHDLYTSEVKSIVSENMHAMSQGDDRGDGGKSSYQEWKEEQRRVSKKAMDRIKQEYVDELRESYCPLKSPTRPTTSTEEELELDRKRQQMLAERAARKKSEKKKKAAKCAVPPTGTKPRVADFCPAPSLESERMVAKCPVPPPGNKPRMADSCHASLLNKSERLAAKCPVPPAGNKPRVTDFCPAPPSKSERVVAKCPIPPAGNRPRATDFCPPPLEHDDEMGENYSKRKRKFKTPQKKPVIKAVYDELEREKKSNEMQSRDMHYQEEYAQNDTYHTARPVDVVPDVIVREGSAKLSYEIEVTRGVPSVLAHANANPACTQAFSPPIAAHPPLIPRQTTKPIRGWTSDTARRGVGFKSKKRLESEKAEKEAREANNNLDEQFGSKWMKTRHHN